MKVPEGSYMPLPQGELQPTLSSLGKEISSKNPSIWHSQAILTHEYVQQTCQRCVAGLNPGIHNSCNGMQTCQRT